MVTSERVLLKTIQTTIGNGWGQT